MKYDILAGRVYSLIPARSGSKGVPDKNIKNLAGYPLIAYSITASRKARCINRTVVSTDSRKYAEIASSFGAEVPFMRPAELSGDKSTDIECLLHFLDYFQKNEKGIPEYVVHLRPTTPVREVAIIEKAVALIVSMPDATALRSVHELPETAYKCLEIVNGRLKPMGTDSFDMDVANLPRQFFPPTYSANGYVDIIKIESFLKTGKIHGSHVIPLLTPVTREVDTTEDFEQIEYELSGKLRNCVPALFGH